ncbi:MAG: hypothetical protein JW889_16360 [Verrucomicrobia bacterium]|nr:hypothetical protein [Verrucomicrobiota bacterium]
MPHRLQLLMVCLGFALQVPCYALTLAPPEGAHQAETPHVIEPTIKEVSEPHRWVSVSGPSSGVVTTLTLCKGEPKVLYAACSYGVYKSTDGAATWQPTTLLRRDGRPKAACDVAVDPTNPLVVYAATDSSVHKSTDGGGSWAELNPGQQRWTDIRCILIDSARADTVYVESGASGVFKTTDGGANWKIKNSGLQLHPGFSRFDIDPRFPRVLYGLSSLLGWDFESKDNGVTWSFDGYIARTMADTTRVSVRSFARDPANKQRLSIVIAYDDKPFQFESTDGGGTWSAKGLVPPGLRVDSILIKENDPNWLRVSIRRESVFYTTTDGAETWRPLALPCEVCELQALRVGGEQGDVLYARTRDDIFHYSFDGGESWELLYATEFDPNAEDTASLAELKRHFLYGLGKADTPHQVQSLFHGATIAHPSNPNTAYRATREGVLRTEDFGTTWHQAKGLSTIRPERIACAAQTPGLLYALNSFFISKTTDGGRTWKDLDGANPSDYCYPPLAVHPLNSNILLVGRRTRAAGGPVCIDAESGTWREVPDAGGDLKGFVFDSEDADVFYVLTHKSICRTTDGGRTWHATSGTMEPDVKDVPGGAPFAHDEQTGLDQTSTDVIYTVRGATTLFRSRDLGVTWTELDHLNVEGKLKFITVHPLDAKTVMAVERNGRLHVSRDAGETWRVVQLPRKPCDDSWWRGCIGMDPKDPQTFYVAGYDDGEGVLCTRDGGTTFEALNSGLPYAKVCQIVVSPADGAVYAAVQGAGIYRLEVGEQTGAEPQGSSRGASPGA